ncbi:hypothetical protein [Janthinobacterium sp. RB2P8]|uniref:hypothetical protein n=1 Tax=Janthinobacterium sp. RB2P8 TaxID=3424191 RepID=UPI003F1F43EE
MNYKDLLAKPISEVVSIKGNVQSAHQDQQSIIATWFDQQPKILNEQDGTSINYADAIIALRKKKFGA